MAMSNKRKEHIERGKLIEWYADAFDTQYGADFFRLLIKGEKEDNEIERYEFLGKHMPDVPVFDFPIAPRDNGPPQTRISLKPRKLRRPPKPVYL